MGTAGQELQRLEGLVGILIIPAFGVTHQTEHNMLTFVELVFKMLIVHLISCLRWSVIMLENS